MKLYQILNARNVIILVTAVLALNRAQFVPLIASEKVLTQILML
jgi:hypothetical protein